MAEEIDQWIKYLHHKCEDLISDPPCKNTRLCLKV